MLLPGLVMLTGLLCLLAALTPRLLAGSRPLSLPMLVTAGGFLAGLVLLSLPGVESELRPLPTEHPDLLLHLATFTVVVSLMGAGLSLDRPWALRSWSSTHRLILLGMPAAILATTLLAGSLLALPLAAAALLAALLAPTDPVLAEEVRVGAPLTEGSAEDEPECPEDDVRFALTSEAGVNDGAAFPFLALAILLGTLPLARSEFSLAAFAAPGDQWLTWFLVDLVGRTFLGLALGYLTGRLFALLAFSSRRGGPRIASHAEGFVAIAATLLAYGAAELVGGYGFLAVFVAACTIRASERFHDYHQVLHDFVSQIERVATVLVLGLLGISLAAGLLAGLRVEEFFFALVMVLLIRPLTAFLSLGRAVPDRAERAAVSWFGVRGVGSVFYLAYALHTLPTGFGVDDASLWRVTGLVILVSILLHGLTAGPVMSYLDRRREQIEPYPEEAPAPASAPASI